MALGSWVMGQRDFPVGDACVTLNEVGAEVAVYFVTRVVTGS